MEQIPSPVHLLVSGIPGAGKSTFARWLGVEYSFHHLDIDFDRYPDATAWLKMPRVVVDWGFPPNCLPFVRDLVAKGFSHWWFDGDRKAAHESYLSRPDNPGLEDAWQIQLERIEQSWEDIAVVFSGRVIDVISAGPVYLSNLERLREMQDRGLRALA